MENNNLMKALLEIRDQVIYRVIDYRVGTGEWKIEDRKQHYDEILAVIEREEQKICGHEVLH